MLVRELTREEAHDPVRRQYVAFWNFAHSLEQSADVRLGLWYDERPGLPLVLQQSIGQTVAVIGWPGSTRYQWTTVAVDTVRRHPEAVPAGRPENVVLARTSLGKGILDLLAARFGYSPEVPGQQNGWVFFDEKPIPQRAPTSRSTLALLPEHSDARRRRALVVGAECLLLVDIDDYWAVLSTLALRVYSAGAALDEGKPVFFAQWTGVGRRTWQIERSSEISQSTIQRRFGAEAARRARSDARSVVVRLNRAA